MFNFFSYFSSLKNWKSSQNIAILKWDNCLSSCSFANAPSLNTSINLYIIWFYKINILYFLDIYKSLHMSLSKTLEEKYFAPSKMELPLDSYGLSLIVTTLHKSIYYSNIWIFSKEINEFY